MGQSSAAKLIFLIPPRTLLGPAGLEASFNFFFLFLFFFFLFLYYKYTKKEKKKKRKPRGACSAEGYTPGAQ